MDGVIWRSDISGRSGDMYAARLATIVDFALSCRKDEVVFSVEESSSQVSFSKDGAVTCFPLSAGYGCPLFVEILAEFERRARKRSDDDAATFQIHGSPTEASATLHLTESENEHRAKLCLTYPGRK